MPPRRYAPGQVLLERRPAHLWMARALSSTDILAGLGGVAVPMANQMNANDEYDGICGCGRVEDMGGASAGGVGVRAAAGGGCWQGRRMCPLRGHRTAF